MVTPESPIIRRAGAKSSPAARLREIRLRSSSEPATNQPVLPWPISTRQAAGASASRPAISAPSLAPTDHGRPSPITPNARAALRRSAHSRCSGQRFPCAPSRLPASLVPARASHKRIKRHDEARRPEAALRAMKIDHGLLQPGEACRGPPSDARPDDMAAIERPPGNRMQALTPHRPSPPTASRPTSTVQAAAIAFGAALPWCGATSGDRRR